jgi:hypothetical protein
MLYPTTYHKITPSTYKGWGMRWHSWFKHFSTSLKIAGLIPDGATAIFHWHNPSDCTMAQGSTQTLTAMSTGIFPGGVKAACA